MEDIRKELDAFLNKQKELGAKRRDICHVLFARQYTESAVGKVMGFTAKTAAAMKVDLSKAGRAKAEKIGKRVHYDFSKANLKRVSGKKVLTQFLSLVEQLLAEECPKEQAHE
jgi:hypothetical protein